ncbi:TIGR00341 family protein [Haladaptatus sp. YSMS36]|uniref:TIGR00341 family protein n=1 Tax=Haladaptatus sp. YSMS36 TaxID=3033384 RepID=UPI0023E7993E|nr:TIGR00341 family protein [Haladaptatus sp. YSMS36]
MRLVQVLIPEGNVDSVLTTLDEQGIDYAVFPEISRGGFEAMVQFPIPISGVEQIMDELERAGIRDDSYAIVLSTETVVSQRIAALEARFPGLRISRDELFARAQDFAPANSTFFAFLILSTIIATTGLLLDSAATIIGAMVVAPLMGPAISASVGTVLGDQKMASRGVKLQISGLIIAILIGAAMGLIVQHTILVPPDLDILGIPQVAERTSPNFLSLFLALGSGIAGAISIMRGTGSSLVGVAIAVALVPPAATAGLGLAWGYPLVALAATVLVVVNLLAINISALVLFYLSGFKPLESNQHQGMVSSLRSRVAIIAVGIVVLSVVLGGVTWTTFQAESIRGETQSTVEAIFDEVATGEQGVVLVDISVEYDATDYILNNQIEVNIILGLPVDVERNPELAQLFDDFLTERTGHDVIVRIGFIEEQVSESIPADVTATVGVIQHQSVASHTDVRLVQSAGEAFVTDSVVA